MNDSTARAKSSLKRFFLFLFWKFYWSINNSPGQELRSQPENTKIYFMPLFLLLEERLRDLCRNRLNIYFISTFFLKNLIYFFCLNWLSNREIESSRVEAFAVNYKSLNGKRALHSQTHFRRRWFGFAVAMRNRKSGLTSRRSAFARWWCARCFVEWFLFQHSASSSCVELIVQHIGAVISCS